MTRRTIQGSLRVIVTARSVCLTGGLPRGTVHILILSASNDMAVEASLSTSRTLRRVSAVPTKGTVLIRSRQTGRVISSTLRLTSDRTSGSFRILIQGNKASRVCLSVRTCTGTREGSMFIVFSKSRGPARSVPRSNTLPRNRRSLSGLVRTVAHKGGGEKPGLDFSSTSREAHCVQFFEESIRFLPDLAPRRLI